MDPAAPQVVVRRSARRKRTVTAYRERDTIVVLLPQAMSVTDEQRYVRDMVSKVLAREARVAAPGGDVELLERARQLAETYLAAPHRPTPVPASVAWVTNQHQRWGSCTPANGTIRLSDRLRAMPAWVVDYVLLHELAHLLEATHSRAFWALVDAYPRADQAKGFLEGYLLGRNQAAPHGPLDQGPAGDTGLLGDVDQSDDDG